MPESPVSISRHATYPTHRTALLKRTSCAVTVLTSFVGTNQSSLPRRPTMQTGQPRWQEPMFQAVLSHPKTSAYPAHSYLQLIGQSRFAFARLVADQSLSGSNFAIRAGLRVKRGWAGQGRLRLSVARTRSTGHTTTVWASGYLLRAGAKLIRQSGSASRSTARQSLVTLG